MVNRSTICNNVEDMLLNRLRTGTSVLKVAAAISGAMLLYGCAGGSGKTGTLPKVVVKTCETPTVNETCDFSITIVKSTGSVETAYQGEVRMSSSDLLADLPAKYVFTASDSGKHNIPILFKTAGEHEIQAYDSRNSAATTVKIPVTVAAGSAASVEWIGPTESAKAGSPIELTLTFFDLYKNITTKFAGSFKFLSSDTAAILPSQVVYAPDSAGAQKVTVILNSSGKQTLSVSASGVVDKTNSIRLVPGKSATIEIIPAASSLSVSGFAASPVAGTNHSFIVSAITPAGQVFTTYSGTVHFTSSDPLAVLPADYTFVPSDQGVHTFSASLATGGARSISATEVGATYVTGSQGQINVGAAGMAKFVLSKADPNSGSAVAGVPSAFVAKATDQYGNLFSGYTGSIHFTSTDPSAIAPGDYTFVAGDNGSHSFPITFRGAGSFGIGVVDSGAGAYTGNLYGISVVPGPPTDMSLGGYPQSTQAGSPVGVSVVLKDSYGNLATNYTGTVRWSSTDTTALLPSDYAFTAADAGLHIFQIQFKKVGLQTLSLTDAAVSTLKNSTNGITVTPASASTFVVSGYPASPAGEVKSVIVTAKDLFGNTSTAYLGAVRLTSSDSQAVLPPNYTFVAGDSGSHVFPVTLKSSGAQSISVTDLANASLTGIQSGIPISPLSANSLSLAFPNTVSAGAATGMIITAKDIFGNIATGYSGTMHFTSTDSKAVLPADFLFRSQDAGVKQLPVTFQTAGIHSLTATDTVQALLTQTQSGIAVNPGTLASFLIGGIPSSLVAGVNTSVTVTAKDQYDNTLVGYRDKVRLTSSDFRAQLSADYSFTAEDAGAHAFTIQLITSGAQSLTVSNLSVPAVNTVKTGIAVTPAAVVKFLVGGVSPPVSAGTGQALSVTAQDSYSNIVTSYSGGIHFTSTDLASTLPADYDFVPGSDSGVHIFSVLFKTVGTQSITATDRVNSSITGAQLGIPVTSGPAAQLVLTGIPTTLAAGVVQTFTATLKDAYQNLVTTYSGTLHLTSSDPRASFPSQNYKFTPADAGSRTLSLILGTVGIQTITVTDANQSSLNANSAGIEVSAGAASLFVVSGYPSPALSGSSNLVTVSAQDAFGNVDTGYLGQVHFSSGDGLAVLPANYVFSAADQGARQFSASLGTVGLQKINAVDTGNSSITGSQVGIFVTPGQASTLFLSYPSSIVAGASGALVLTLKDVNNNVATGYRGTIHFTSTDAIATLPVDYTFTAADSGTHSFNQILKQAGIQSITATDKATGSISATQSGISVISGGATTLAVSGHPASTRAGVINSIIVKVKDTLGNVVTGYTGTVQFTSTDSLATLPGSYTFISGDAGVHTFPVTLKSTGNQSITAKDSIGSSIIGTQSGISVAPGPAASIQLAGYPATVGAGTSGTVTVKIQDAFGNIASDYLGTVHLTSSDGLASLPADYAFLAGDAGVHAFNTSLRTVGSQSITARDTVATEVTGSHAGIVVTAAPAAHLMLNGFSNSVAGNVGSITVSLKDTYGNIASGYRGTLSFSSSDSLALLPPNYTFRGEDAGVHEFSITLKTVGLQSITLVDMAQSALTSTQAGITVTAGAASSFQVGGFPSFIGSRVPSNLSVTAKDAYGNIASGYLGTVHFSSTDSTAILPANYTFVSGDAGVRSFAVTLKKSGMQSITATDVTQSSIAGQQTDISVGELGTSVVLISGYPNTVDAGTAHTFTLGVADAYGNPDTSYTGTVHFSSSDPTATLPDDYTFLPADAGIRTFNLILKTSGSQIFTATDTVNGSLTGSRAGITVNPGSASSLILNNYPDSVVAGTSRAFKVTAKDTYGNTASGYRGTISLASSDSTAVLPANYTFTDGDLGQHTFTGTLKRSGTQNLSASDTITPSITGMQSGIVVNADSASTLVLNGYPSAVTAGISKNLTVSAHDAFGNLAVGYLGTVKFTSSDAASSLPDSYTFVAEDSGTHTFPVVLKTKAIQTLTVADTEVSAITQTQSGIVVNSAALDHLAVAEYPSSVVAGTSNAVVVTAVDAFNNLVNDYLGTVTLTSSDTLAVLPGSYTFLTSDLGVHSFVVALKTVGSHNIIVTDAEVGTITGSQTDIGVHAASAAIIKITGYPLIATAGVANSFAVSLADIYGNPVIDYSGTVHFGSSDFIATLPSDYTFLPSDSGAHTFTAALKTSGTQTLSVTDVADSAITSSQSGIQVLAANVFNFAISGFPSSVSAGVSTDLTVTAQDSYSNPVTDYIGTVHFSSTDAAATLPQSYTFLPGDSGVHAFAATLITSGPQSIQVADGVNEAIWDPCPAFKLIQDLLRFSTYPGSRTRSPQVIQVALPW